MNILVLGSGGREYALAWKISQSKSVNKIFISIKKERDKGYHSRND